MGADSLPGAAVGGGVRLRAAAGGGRAALGDALAGALWRTYGQTWDLAPTPPPAGLDRPDAVGLQRLTADDFPPPDPAPQRDEEGNLLPVPNPAPDRWFVVTVEEAPAGFALAGREWDGSRRVLGPLRRRAAATTGSLPFAAAALVRGLFHAEYRVTTPPDAIPGTTTVHLAARAAALPVRDPAADPLRPGTLLSVYLRLYARDGGLEEVRETPLTYLVLGEPAFPDLRGGDPAGVREAETVSLLRQAVGRTRGRDVTLARPILQDLPSTELTLTARGTDGRPLVGYTILVADRRALPTEAPPKLDEEGEPLPPEIPADYPEPIREISDRRGRVTIPAAPPAPAGAEREPGLVWLHVYSGKAKLGTLPYVAGAVPTDTLELDDDALRLGLEGDYALLAGEMTEVVVNRAVLSARAKKAAKAKDFDAAHARLDDLAALPRAEAFKRRIDALAAGVRQAALKKGDRLTAARADKLAAKMKELADAYLTADAVPAARAAVEAEYAPGQRDRARRDERQRRGRN